MAKCNWLTPLTFKGLNCPLIAGGWRNSRKR